MISYVRCFVFIGDMDFCLFDFCCSMRWTVTLDPTAAGRRVQSRSPVHIWIDVCVFLAVVFCNPESALGLSFASGFQTQDMSAVYGHG